MNQEPKEPGEDLLWGQLSQAWRQGGTEQEQRQIEEAAAVAARERTASFSRSILRRNLREWLASAVVLVSGLATASSAGTWSGRAGGVFLALGALYVGVWIFHNGKDLPAPGPGARTSEHLAHEVAQLERQARLLEQIRWHYLAPLLPGVLLMLASGLEGAARRGALSGAMGATLWASLLLPFTLVTLVFAGVDALNQRAARTLRLRQQQARELAGIPQDPPATLPLDQQERGPGG
ncbi:MAG: hypothetical protein MUF64_03630 [Polyangiaceae bacterium]|jgi:hypothetical protein|nr:hypothetical protein [Polyangiaceae bacterium]